MAQILSNLLFQALNLLIWSFSDCLVRRFWLRTAPRFIKYNLMRSLHEQEQMKEMNQLRFVPRRPCYSYCKGHFEGVRPCKASLFGVV